MALIEVYIPLILRGDNVCSFICTRRANVWHGKGFSGGRVSDDLGSATARLELDGLRSLFISQEEALRGV